MSTSEHSFKEDKATPGEEQSFFSAKKDLLKTLGQNLPENPTGTARFLKNTLEFNPDLPSDLSQYSPESRS